MSAWYTCGECGNDYSASQSHAGDPIKACSETCETILKLRASVALRTSERDGAWVEIAEKNERLARLTSERDEARAELAAIRSEATVNRIMNGISPDDWGSARKNIRAALGMPEVKP